MLKKTSVIISIILIACAFNAQAFNFEPITQDYAPTGKGSNHIFRVANPGTENIAIKISVKPRSLEPDGTEIQGDDSNLFTIYPRQVILKPNESRSIRVKWTGEAAPQSELAFRIIAEQVPVSFAEVQPIEGGQITLTYRYEGNIYIVPPGAKPDLAIKSMRRDFENENTTETEAGQEFLVFEIENKGNRHTLLSKIELKLKRDENDSQPIILADDKLKGVAGENMLAGSVRIFRIPMPAGIWEGPVYGSIKQDSAK